MTKYIFITGGVVSSLGKGILTSSLGALLRARGYRVTAIKIDPYVNVDAGTMRPYEHGEVVLVDVDCGPCQKPVCRTDHRCMTRIGVERVVEAADRHSSMPFAGSPPLSP